MSASCGPSEAALWHGVIHARMGAGYEADMGRAAIRAAHDPALGTDRSVNEAWCRTDQTRQIVEWLVLTVAGREAAALVDIKFGGGSDAD